TWSWVDPIDLSDYTGTDSVYVGFKYISTDSDAAAWEIDSISVDTEAAVNNAPEISNVNFSPTEPVGDEQVEVTATITDEDGDDINAELRYGTTQDELSDTTEFAETESENEYAGVISGFDAGTTVYFEIMATDGEEETTATGDYEVVEDEDEPNAIINQEELSVNVYPNPGNGNYSIELDSEMNESINVMVFNAVGKLVYQKKYQNPSSKETINITNQNDGIYFLKVTSNKTEKVIKLIKE
ncbi:MAG: T9SS type A sorting domain-containing protein, partial [Bacteroidota bacterium]